MYLVCRTIGLLDYRSDPILYGPWPDQGRKWTVIYVHSPWPDQGRLYTVKWMAIIRTQSDKKGTQ